MLTDTELIDPASAEHLIEEGAAAIASDALDGVARSKKATSGRRKLRCDRDRRRPGGSSRRLSPGAGGPALCHPRRERTHRGLLAQTLGFATTVHAGEAGRSRRDALFGAAQLRFQPRTRWRTISPPMPRGFNFQCAAACASISCSSSGSRYVIQTGALELEASQVVVAMAGYQRPKSPHRSRRRCRRKSCRCIRAPTAT